MSFEQEDQSKPSFDNQTNQNLPNRKVRSRVGNFFGWLGELITEQAQIDAQVDEVQPPLHMLHEIKLRQQKTSEVIANAKVICRHLEETKQKLAAEFGASAGCFIVKCIDPMTEHARHLILLLEQPTPAGSSLQNLLEQAIESVELYAQFSDEAKLKRKIVQVGQGYIKQAIDKDLEMLANYKFHAFEKGQMLPMEKRGREFELDRYLYPIVSELVGMADSRQETDDLHAFLVWKTTVDERRNSLMELGYLTIDAMRGQSEAVLSGYKSHESILDEPFDELIRHELEDNSLSMSFLSILEDRTNDLFNRMEEQASEDTEAVDTMQQLLDYLKVDAERFQAISAHTKHVLDSFKRLKDQLVRAEVLLQEKKVS